MHMLLRLSLILLLLVSTSGGLFKKKKENKPTNNNKKLFRKDVGVIESSGGNYIGVKVAKKSKDELTHSQAQARCQTDYGTSLATILNEDDWKEIVELLWDKDWGNAVARVWVGFRRDGVNRFAWEPCSFCEEGYDCYAEDVILYADWHSYGNDEGLSIDMANDPVAYCGALHRNTKNLIGKWILNPCDRKREFICNDPAGKYGSPAFQCEKACDSQINNGALNIAFLLDEALDLTAANAWAKKIVELDVNDESFVSVFEFKGEDWRTYRQTVDFMKDKAAVMDAIESNEKDETYEDFNMVGSVNEDVLDKVMTLIHDVDSPVCDGCESNVIIVFLSADSQDILSDTVANYNQGVGVIFVVVGSDGGDFPNLEKLAEHRYPTWSDQNVFYVDPSASDFGSKADEVGSFINAKVCTSFDEVSSSAWRMESVMIGGQELIVNGKPSFVGVLLGLMGVLVALNLICFTLSICNKRSANKKHRYAVVDAESSELSS